MCKVIGIDISKQTFDAAFLEDEKWQHEKLSNDEAGFKNLMTKIKKEDWVVMEASGSYFLKLATYFYKQGIKVSVVNPLIIRRFSQTNFYRAKTDKKDAQTISEYGTRFDLKEWSPNSEANQRLRQIYTRISLLDKQIHQTRRQLEAFEATGCLDKDLKKETQKVIKQLSTSKEVLEKKIKQIAEEAYGDTLKHLQTIQGIGIKAAIVLTVITDNFTKFETAKQLTAYIGFSPRIYQSGTSVNGRGHICKMGSSQVRKILYVCSWSAKRSNEYCMEMYDRLKEKGKPERVIKIAMANKLLRQAFAVGKNHTDYKKKSA